mgnify:CR=1 FL=1
MILRMGLPCARAGPAVRGFNVPREKRAEA